MSYLLRHIGQCACVIGVSAGLLLMGVTPPCASAEPADCTEELSAYDPYDLVEDVDLPVDLDTLIEVDGLVDDYTARIDDAVEAEDEGLEPEDESSDELIDDARWEISDAIDLGRSIAECEEA